MYILLLALLFFPTFALAQFSIDSPLPGSVQSGTVAPPNGWRCTAGEITASLNNGPTINFTERQNRGDTAGSCDNTGDNAFIIAQPWNWNVFGDGQQEIVFFDDGVPFASITFEIATFGTEFLIGPAVSFTVPNFPDSGGNVVVSWDAAIQNFRITRVDDGSAETVPDVAGTWIADAALFVNLECPAALIARAGVTIHRPVFVEQTGNTLSGSFGSLPVTGTIEGDGAFTLLSGPETQETEGCTYTQTTRLGGNFLDRFLGVRVGFDEISGDCVPLDLPCAVVLSGTIEPE